MKTVQFPLPKFGIDKLSDETSLLPGTWRSVTNIDISRAGQMATRNGFTQLASGEYHSIWFAPQRSLMLAAKNGTLYSVNTTSGATTALVNTGSQTILSYCEYNGNVYATNAGGVFVMPNNSTTMSRCGTAAPQPPVVTASPNGGLVAGKYAVAISTVNAAGEESGSTEPQLVTLSTDGGIQLSGLPIVSGGAVAIYVTTTNGDVLYEYARPPATFTTHLISATPTGGTIATQYLTPFQGGHSVRWHNGRLYVANGDTLWYSDAFRPHLTRLDTNFVQFSGTISFVEAVQGGIYVGDDRGVWFLDGGDPTKFELKRVSGCRAIPGTSLVVPNEHFDQKVVNTQLPVATWLCTSGYAVGTAEGSVIELNADKVRVPLSATGASTFSIRKGRKQVVTLVSTPTNATGLAVDTPA